MFTHVFSRLAAGVFAGLIGFALAAPAFARDTYVNDGAQLFGSATVADLNREIADFNGHTGKEIVVVTVPSLNGQTLNAAAEDTFAKQQVNGVLFFFAKAEKQDIIVGDTASRAFFPSGTFENIHDAMRGYLRSGDFDLAIATGVNLVLDQYRGHERTAPAGYPARTQTSVYTRSRNSSQGGAMSLIWLAIILFAGFIIIRGIFRALAGPRMMPPGVPGAPGAPGPMPGPGYGYGGYGGGGFFSGLLGGLGGAWLGNELFGGGRQFGGGDVGQAGFGNAGSVGDTSGWQADPGQADIGGAGGGSWGDAGGGFDPGGGGGFGDGGGFGGGDSGGG